MNKYKLLIVICFFFLTILMPQVTATIKGYELMGKIICLDSGHGGPDIGAQSKDVIEKELNLIIAKKLEKELISRGAIVYQTREDDYDLSTTNINRKRSDLYNRAKYINEIKPNIFLSIHLNATTSPKWKGLQVFYTNKNEKNELLAKTITNYLNQNISNVRDSKQNNSYYMYNHISYPGVLIEAGFISNPNDNYILRQSNYQNKLVSLIADSIEIYFKNPK